MLTIQEEFVALCNIKIVSDNLDDELFEKLGGTITRATINKIKKYFDITLPSDNIKTTKTKPEEPVEEPIEEPVEEPVESEGN